MQLHLLLILEILLHFEVDDVFLTHLEQRLIGNE